MNFDDTPQEAAFRMLQQTGSPVRIRSLTTVGTPWQGSFLSDYANGITPLSDCLGDAFHLVGFIDDTPAISPPRSMRFDVNPLRPASSHDPRRRQTPAAQMPQRNRNGDQRERERRLAPQIGHGRGRRHARHQEHEEYLMIAVRRALVA